MELQHAIQAMPRPRIKRQPFRPGDVVVSKSSGARVRVEEIAGQYFSGECIGQRGKPNYRPQHKYFCNCWVAANFERETV